MATVVVGCSVCRVPCLKEQVYIVQLQPKSGLLPGAIFTAC